MSIIVSNVTVGAGETLRQIDEEDSRVRAQIRRNAQNRQLADQMQLRQRFDQRMRPDASGQPPRRELSAKLPLVPQSAAPAGNDESAPVRNPARDPGMHRASGGAQELAARAAMLGNRPALLCDPPLVNAQSAPVAAAAHEQPPLTPRDATSRQSLEPDRPRRPGVAEQHPEKELPHSDQDTAQAVEDTFLPKRLAELARAVSGQQISLQADQLLMRLEDIADRIGGTQAAADNHETHGQAKNFLEFLSGYFEMERDRPGPGQKVCVVVQDLQERMAQVEQALQIAAGAPANVLSQASAASAVRSMVSSRRRTDDETGPARKRLPAHEAVATDELAMQTSLTIEARTSVTAEMPVRRSRLSKDAEKRRGETLAEVTVRSV